MFNKNVLVIKYIIINKIIFLQFLFLFLRIIIIVEKENKKEQHIQDKEYQVNIKESENIVKEYEVFSKSNEVNAKMGVKIEKYSFPDNKTKGGKIKRFIFVTLIFAVVILGAYFALKYTGMLDKFNSAEDIKNFILSGGNLSVFLFILLQFLQVTFLPLPAFLTTVVGALIFGPLNSFIMSLFAIILGSVFAFYLGRKFGKGILAWIAGKEDAEKWSRKLTNGKYAFFLMMLFPLFPDDVLCVAAGVTNMSFKFFLITNLITRPIGIFCICFLGSGELIPFSGYGLIVWPILIILLIVCFIVSIKYQDKIEKLIDNLSNKMKNKNK